MSHRRGSARIECLDGRRLARMRMPWTSCRIRPPWFGEASNTGVGKTFRFPQVCVRRFFVSLSSPCKQDIRPIRMRGMYAYQEVSRVGRLHPETIISEGLFVSSNYTLTSSIASPAVPRSIRTTNSAWEGQGPSYSVPSRAQAGSTSASKVISQQFDACASWWTQDPDTTLQSELAREAAHTAGRYGHVLFPENVHEPALRYAELLLAGVGRGWAERVFFSANGSTAIEVAFKMAFRKDSIDHNFCDPSTSGGNRVQFEVSREGLIPRATHSLPTTGSLAFTTSSCLQ